MTTAEVIATLKRRGWTVTAIARRVGRVPQTVHRWARESRVPDEDSTDALRALLAEPPQRNPRRWRPRRSDLVLACIHAGVTRTQIAQTCGVSLGSVSQWISGRTAIARRHEPTLIALAAGSRVEISPDDDTQTIVHGLRARGWTSEQMADRCGVHAVTVSRWGRVAMTGKYDASAREGLIPLIDEDPPIVTGHQRPPQAKIAVAVVDDRCPITLQRPEIPDPKHIARRLRFVMDRARLSASRVASSAGSGRPAIKTLLRDPEEADYRTLAALDAWLHRLDERPLTYWLAHAVMADGPETAEQLEKGESPARVQAVADAVIEGWIVERDGMLWWAGWDEEGS